MNCQEIQALVEEVIDDRLSASCRHEVNQHLPRCAECRAFLAARKSEHAALSRALNDVSDIPPPATPQAALASRLADVAIHAAKRAGSITVPPWLKRAAVITFLCGGAAFAAWIGTNMESRHIGGDNPEGEPKMKRTLLAATATIALAAIPAQGSSSAEATFDSFSSEFRTSASAEATAFLSRYRTIEDSDALSSFDSTEPRGLIIFVH